MLERFKVSVLALVVLCSPQVASAQPSDSVRNAARDEGLVRYVVDSCFIKGSAEQVKLGAQSARYIRRLSAASGVPVAELEGLTDAGFVAAKATKKLSSEQCKKGRDTTIKLLAERDAKLAG